MDIELIKSKALMATEDESKITYWLNCGDFLCVSKFNLNRMIQYKHDYLQYAISEDCGETWQLMM